MDIAGKTIILIWLFSVLGLQGHGQESPESNDYQYALIEAVKQKNLGNIQEAVKLYRLVVQAKPDCDVAYYELGTIYLVTGQLDLAEEFMGKAYSLDPGNKWYTLGYLNALGAGEDYADAAKLLKEKIRAVPDEVEWEYQLANVRFSQGKAKRAIKLLEKIEKERGFSEKITLLKASIYESQDKYELAREEIEKVMNLFPEAVQFRIAAAELSMKEGDEDRAAEYYHDILEIDSTNIFALTNLTDYYRKQENYQKSFQYLTSSFRNELIDVKRKMAILSYYLSEERFINEYPEELETLFNVLLEMHPEVSEIKLMAADFHLERRDYEAAFYQLQDFLDTGEGSYPVYMQAIFLANAAGLNDDLIRMTDKAMAQYPDSADIRFFRGIGMYEEQRYEEVVTNFEQFSFQELSRKEYMMQSKMLYAEALYRTGDYQRSDAVFEALIEEDPENFMVLNNFSYYLAERGEMLEKAEKWSRRVITNQPDNFTYLDTYAWVLFKMEEYENAEKYILEALRKGGENDPEVNEHAGDIMKALKSYEMAESYYDKAIILGGQRTVLEEKIEGLKNAGDK
ncbi:MAG TPA: tetratricopeptide repeat protein [Bacteroides sp.]|nr:tetratricopeptide repeat protein [Bacteroides sp.]